MIENVILNAFALLENGSLRDGNADSPNRRENFIYSRYFTSSLNTQTENMRLKQRE